MLNLRVGSALSRASTLGQNGILAYTGLNVPEVYSEEFVKYYDAGLSGMSIRSADKVTGSVMPEDMKSLAHEAGRLDARAYANKNAPDNSGTENVKYSLSPTKRARLEKNIIDLSNASIKKTAGNKSIKISTDQFSVNKAVYSKKGRSDKEVNARIKAIPDFESIIKGSTYSHTDTNIVGLDNAAKKNVIAMHYFKTTYNGFDVEIVVRDKGQKQFLYEVKFIDNKKSSQQSMPKGIDSPAPKGDVENKAIVSQKAKNVKKAQGKAMLKSTSAGFTEGERAAPIDAEGQAFLDKLGKVLGIEITYDDADESKYNGYYINGKMVIARSANVPYLTVVAHETTHRFIESDPKGARAYGNYVIQKMFKGKTLDAEIRRIIDAHRSKGKYIDRVGAMEEICANYTELMLKDVSLFQKLAQENYNLAHKILDFLKDVLARINAALPRKNAKVDRYGLNHAQMERAARLWQRALRRSEKNVSKSADSVTESTETVTESTETVTENKNTSEESEAANVKYSIDPSFERVFNSWIKKGMPEGYRLYVGRTSDALKSIGVKEQDIYWDSSKIRTTFNDHGHYLTDGILKQVPQAIENPIIIMKSKSIPSRLTMFGEVYNANNLPLLVVLELEPTGHNTGVLLDEIKVVSSHSRENKNNPKDMTPTQNFIDTSEILYLDPNKKRTDTWFRANRLQLPLHITKYGPIKRITYPLGNVNTQSMQISKNDSQKPEGKASLKILGEEFADVSVFESGKLKDFTRKKVQRKQLKVASHDEMKSWASSLDGVDYGDFVALRHLFEEACFDVGNEEKINRVIERALQLAVIDAQATFGLKPFVKGLNFNLIFFK